MLLKTPRSKRVDTIIRRAEKIIQEAKESDLMNGSHPKIPTIRYYDGYIGNGSKFAISVPRTLTAIELEEIKQGIYHECIDWFGDFEYDDDSAKITFTFEP